MTTDTEQTLDIYGQGPSDHPDLPEWWVREGIEFISLNPDTVIATWKLIAQMHWMAYWLEEDGVCGYIISAYTIILI